MILGFLSIFKKSQASSPFEALNFAGLSRCQRNVRPPVQMRRDLGLSLGSPQGPDMRSVCEMKDKPAFKPLQGNLAFIQVRVARCPFHLRQQTQGSSQIPIAEGSLLLRCLWKVGLPLHSKPGNHFSSRDDMGYMELSSSCCAEIGGPPELRRVSPGISGVS